MGSSRTVDQGEHWSDVGVPLGGKARCSDRASAVLVWRGIHGRARTDCGELENDRRAANGTLGFQANPRGVQFLTETGMGAIPVELDPDLVALLEELQRPAKETARELMVLELYRQGDVSSGRAAQLLGMEREEFIRYASKQGIPYLQLEGEELQRELDAIKKL